MTTTLWNLSLHVGLVTDYCVSCQINACERATNQSRLRETRLVLKLYYTNSMNDKYDIPSRGGAELFSSCVPRVCPILTPPQGLEKTIFKKRLVNSYSSLAAHTRVGQISH